MNWGKGIVLAFALFIGVIATLVTISMREDVSLVAKDYYVQELAYQDQITRIHNTRQLGDAKPKISYDRGRQVLQLSLNEQAVINGNLKLFRPSNAQQDREFVLNPNGGFNHTFDTSDLIPGLYKARLYWEQNGKPCYMEKIINI